VGGRWSANVLRFDRLLGRADELAERAVARHAEAPPNMYWYSSGFFTLQRGFTWHTLKFRAELQPMQHWAFVAHGEDVQFPLMAGC
jgi:hypothetical protein